MPVSRADLLDQLLYLRDELALLGPLLPRLSAPLLEERPRPDQPSFAETLDALAEADRARLAAAGHDAPPLPDAPALADKLDRFVHGRTALHDALAALPATTPAGETVEAAAHRAIHEDAEAMRAIGAFLFEALHR